MKRKIVEIDQELCNGCGLCVDACHEMAIELVNGKAQLVSDKYCDGLGDCLPACPVDAIRIIEREADPYDDDAVQQRIANAKKEPEELACGCPGQLARLLNQGDVPKEQSKPNLPKEDSEPRKSELRQWPIQIQLINPRADYLQGADLLIAADCTAYAHADFHTELIKGRITMIGCPKLDDNRYNVEKIAEILKYNDIKSITVARMSVPCCGGIVQAVKQAMLQTETIVPYNEVIINV